MSELSRLDKAKEQVRTACSALSMNILMKLGQAGQGQGPGAEL
jgi:hypothetical protein